MVFLVRSLLRVAGFLFIGTRVIVRVFLCFARVLYMRIQFKIVKVQQSFRSAFSNYHSMVLHRWCIGV